MKLGLEEAGSDEFPLLHDSVSTHQLTVGDQETCDP